MYRVEYLVIVEQHNCSNVKALKSLIQSDSDFSIGREQIDVSGFKFNYEISSGNIATGKKQVYFQIRTWVDEASEIPAFTKALRKLRGTLSLINKTQHIIWDDISRYYSEQAYGRINYIENLMRKLLTKFMLVNLGMGWDKDRMPVDVKKSTNPNNKDVNILNNVDFIQLRNFLFSENYPAHKDGLIRKLRNAKNLNDTGIEEIKSLLPVSNWTKYFEEIVECSGDYLDKKWKKLYDLRNAIAHNKSFSESELNEVNEIIDSIQDYIEDAIRKLDEVVVPDEDIEDVTESVAGENNKLIGSFITVWREFENAAYALYRQNTDKHSSSARIGIFQVLKSLLEKDLINNTQHNEIDELRKLRNSLVHSVGVDYPLGHIEGTISTITQYTNGLQQALRIEEADHLEKIRNKEIVATYEKIKGFILMKEGVELKINKHYISFVKNGNFVDVKLQQSAVKIWLNLNKGELDDPRNIAKDVSNTGHLGNGDYEVSVKGLSDFSYISGLIDQAYRKAANKE